MDAESIEPASSAGGGLPLTRFVSTFWGLAAITVLAVFTLVQTMTYTPEPRVSTRPNIAAAVPEQPRVSRFANYVAPDAPPIERLGPIIYITCGPDDVQGRGGGAPGRYPITMRLDQVPDDIRAVLSGTDTVFPKDTPVVKTACIQGMISRGELP